MSPMDDSDSAFSLLVQRHLSLVHSAARRQVAGDLTLAEEVTQRTFCLLTNRAAVLRPEGSLAGWLHATAGYVARECLRGERRRRFREHQAAEMQSNENHSPPPDHWKEIAPLLDPAIQALPAVDRQAVFSRFFERRSMRDVGRVLGVTEDAAKVRVSRAVIRLRQYFLGQSVGVTVTALAMLLWDRSVEAAPASVLKSVQAALANRTVGVAVSSSLLTKFLIMSSPTLKTATVAIVLVAGTLLVGFEIKRAASSPKDAGAVAGGSRSKRALAKSWRAAPFAGSSVR